MTANVVAGDREQILAAGMVDHISKPLDVDDMFATIARWIIPANPIAIELAPASAPSLHWLVIPGLDAEAGLARTMSNGVLYRRLLLDFRESQANFADVFARARVGDDPSAAIRCAHTLSGNAGNIGAKDVQAAAAALERGCREPASDDAIDQLLSRTLAALHPVIDGLAKLQPGNARLIDTDRVDKSAARDSVNRLKNLLEESNLEAADVVEELERSLSGTVLAEAMVDVSRAVARFDVDAALNSLRGVAEAIERQ
jgi:two-component system sensor histidine kinase/response regulator